MVERTRARCPACRTAVPVTLLWAAGNSCPFCAQPFQRPARRPPQPDRLLARTIELLRATPRRDAPTARRVDG